MTLKLVGIGGMGLMLSPSAAHLQSSDCAKFIRILDRGTKDPRREESRQSWLNHGASLVSDYQSLLKDHDYDGVVICAGKNGDDCAILSSVLPQLEDHNKKPFILQLSTVSAEFTSAASQHLSSAGIEYANYPLTGGPLGAQTASMLILASGDMAFYERLEPTLSCIGSPKYFGSSVTAGAEVKLMGQLMVFNGLMGISSAAALKSACFSEEVSGESQTEFFNFLNGGAGGTRQWDVALSKGVKDNTWDQGFMIHHAVVDAIYAAKLCQQRQLPALAIIPMISIALGFAFLLSKYADSPLATHAIVREMLAQNAGEVNQFINQRVDYTNIDQSISNVIEVLPDAVKATVLLDINSQSFS